MAAVDERTGRSDPFRGASAAALVGRANARLDEARLL